MPPRPPPTPPVLTVLCSVAAVVAVWLSLAVDQVARGVAGMALGVPLRGFVVTSDAYFVVAVQQGATDHLGAWGWAAMVLAGSGCVVLLALGQHVVVSAIRAAGWLRGLSLGWVVVALLWLPLSLAAAALPAARTAGPVAELYRRLGAPMAGRWAAGALGLLVLLIAGAVITDRAVAVGRAWMRADGVEFRRRLVRVTAGWPGIVATFALAVGAGWAPSLWMLLVGAVVLAALQLETT